jgi:nitrogenase molybdenum-iron protein alpha/beta subunit
MMIFPGGGFKGSYRAGAEEVLLNLTQNIVGEPIKKHPGKVNLLGITPDSFNYASDISELKRLLKRAGIQVHTVLTQNTSVEEIEKISESALNLVVSDSGLKAAQVLKKRFETPFIRTLPFGLRGTVEWLEAVEEALNISFNKAEIAKELKRYGETLGLHASMRRPFDRLRVGVSGSNTYVKGLSQFLSQECAMDVVLAVVEAGTSEKETKEFLNALGIETVLSSQKDTDVSKAVEELGLHVLFGNSYTLNRAKNVPVKIHSAFPSYDFYNAYDGTPFLGFRGNAYLIQLLVNQVNQHPEVWKL